MSLESRPETSTPAGDWREAVSRDEIQSLLQPNDWRSLGSLCLDWAIVFAAMAAVAWWPHGPTLPLAILVALFLIGARQLGLAVLMHEAAHYSLFSNRRVNDFVGNWLAAYPIWSNTETYRNYHLRHHAKTWTEEDPDLNLATPFPVTRASLWRKIGRDLSGRTGLKFARFGLRRDLGFGAELSPEELRRGRQRFAGFVLTNGVLLAGLAAVGFAEGYLLWVVAWLTTNTLVTRIRSIAEHSMSPDPSDPLQNTRTTLAGPFERLFLAPNRVNYHLEHHLLMTVPHYNLPRFHSLLAERGLLERALVGRGYFSLLREASSRAT
ncbi:MAG: fatty acid desaturase family protein [Proteobacteria bacterium]|nr:fatty acid desaturase family protein [Pseudomonadota bacterium]